MTAMTSRDWWIGVAAVVLAILLHAAVPRYEWRHVEGPLFTRVDRWTGDMRFGAFIPGQGWVERGTSEMVPPR